MIISISLVILASILLSLGSVFAQSGDIKDSFENGIDNYSNHGGQATYTHINNQNQARTGSRALKIISMNSDSKPNSISELTRWFTKINYIDVKPGENYQISVYMKSQGLVDNAKLAISFFESTSGKSWISTQSARKTLTGNTNWTKVVIDIEVPNGAKFMRPEFRLFDKGTLWIDDFTVSVINPTRNNQQQANTNTSAENNQTIKQLITQSSNDPTEIVTRDQPPEDIAVNQPSKSVESADYSINFSQSEVLSAKRVSADLTMRISVPVNCDFSHSKNDDPIVYPNQEGASHSHDFFGDTKVDAFSTVQQILDNGGNTCFPGDDRSAYWVPTVYQNGNKQKASRTKFYYKAGFVDPQSIKNVPTGLRMIAGNANAKSNQSPQVGFWYAAPDLVSSENVPNLSNSTRGKNSMVVANEGDGISLRINFPQCWDGESLYLPNSVHMAYPNRRGKDSFATCPATHPVALPMILMIIDYPNAKGGSGFTLSSGPWYTFHADFVNAWHPDSLQGLIDSCIKTDSRCRVVREGSCRQRGLAANKCAEVRRE